MQNRLGIWILTVVVAVLSIYYLSFTFVARGIRKDAETFATGKDGLVDQKKKERYLDSLRREPVYLGSTYQEVTQRELGLGLDLQGGMHVVLEVAPTDILRGLAGGNARNSQFNEALKQATEAQKSSQSNFVDLFVSSYKKVAPSATLAQIFSNSTNRGKISNSSSDSEVTKFLKEEVDGATSRAFQIIQQRVDKFGVANPNIQRLPGSGRILIELPGVDNPERVRRLLTGSAKLEFCEVYTLDEVSPALNALGAYLTQLDLEKKIAEKGTSAADTSKAGGLAAQLAKGAKTDSTSKDTTANQTGLASLFVPISQGQLGVYAKDTARANELLARTEVKAMFPSDAVIMWDRKGIETTDKRNEIVGIYFIKKANGQAPLEGDVIVDATGNNYDDRGRPEVSMRMNAEGARKWKNLTAANVGRPVAIILDGFVYTAPNVQNEIPNGNSSITGSFTIDETKDMANVLKAGKLPAPTTIVEEAIVGATLGSESVSAGVISSLVGLLVVLIFMVIYYNKAGMIADVALIINLFFLMGIMASLGAILTLPGIAGIVLTIGMAVDANVLVFERIKEELAAGKELKLAISDGFKNSLSSILDSNVTTLLTGIILFFLGTGLILGFATTLVIGILTSLFAALFVSRLILEWWVGKGRKIEFFASWSQNLFKDANFDFVSRRRVYYIISSVIIGLGIISVIFKGFGLGVDFKGGRSYVVRFEKGVETSEVREILTGVFGAAPEVKTFGGIGIGANEQVKVTTSFLADATTPDADKQAEAKLNEGLSKLPGNKATIQSSQKVGPTIAFDLIMTSLKSILLAVLVVSIYIFIRFRKVAFVWGAIVALFHDVLVILAVFSIFNGLLPFSLDVDQAFIGAVLTIMGYSMNDTVVVFDRVREYLRDNKGKKETIPAIINNALNSTLSRTAVTGLSTMFVLIVLFFFGGEVIRGFSFAMLIGVIVGTYSSLFVATPIVVDSLTRDQAKDEAAGDAKKAAPARLISDFPDTPRGGLQQVEMPQEEEEEKEKVKKEKKAPLIKPSLKK
ncbi:protein translocase subunit SecDF [Runella rosea]|uniref:Multifunctional fusion protein n=1 Tax=Runella rosea TaxID=2259595 RepID=A0A344TM45_9BACT|nr:protein translocase subunit SecDF [Runella rosea]AXE19716.1 protein translocase subunit SecDF [Runella rosea]